MMLKPYKRKAFYYETDRMGIVHHSNYVRWVEEARVDMLNKMNLPFTDIEAQGLMVPVLSVNCEYKYPVRFDDEFEVRCTLKSFNGAKFEVAYEIYNLTRDKLSLIATSSHCFTDKNLRPCRLKKNYPNIYDAFEKYVEK